MQIEMTEKNMQTTLAKTELLYCVRVKGINLPKRLKPTLYKDIEKFDWINNIFVNNPNSS